MTTLPGQWVHMVGIAGAGMSGIAKVLYEQGVKVSGSDLQINNGTKKLQEMGIEIFEGHSSSNLGEGVDLLVISSAIPQHNAEIIAAKERNIPIIKRGQMLARMVNPCKGLAVAGAHGKTTTTSMLYSVLNHCGSDPSFIVGGEIQESRLNARLGGSQFFVVEADESDASFLELKPYVAIVTNVENDHLDYYHSFQHIQEAFQQFINQVDPTGYAVLYGGDSSLRAIHKKSKGRTRALLYGQDSDCDYYLQHWKVRGMGSVYEAFYHGKSLGWVELSVPGLHNALNSLAVLATALELGLELPDIIEGLKLFKGAKRRFQILYNSRGKLVVDDYAHHPSEIKATIDAARNFHRGRIIVIFQPHRYSRTKLLVEQFGQSFLKADLTVIADIYSAGEQPLPGVSGEIIHEAAQKAGCNVRYIPNQDQIEEFINKELREDDLLITMGAGDIWKLGVSIAEKLLTPVPQAKS